MTSSFVDRPCRESGDDAGDDEGSDADMEEVDDDNVQDVLLLKAYKTLKKYLYACMRSSSFQNFWQFI